MLHLTVQLLKHTAFYSLNTVDYGTVKGPEKDEQLIYNFVLMRGSSPVTATERKLLKRLRKLVATHTQSGDIIKISQLSTVCRCQGQR